MGSGGIVIVNKTYQGLPFCEKEILRYAGCQSAQSQVMSLLRACIDEAREALVYRVCYRLLPVTIEGDCCDFGIFRLRSEKLAVNLSGCHSSIVMAATVGVGIDRLITRYGRIVPSKALMMQAIGAAQIEVLCDTFCESMEQELAKALRPRFSPGYGDLSLQVQRDIFAALECEKRIGLTLNASLLMSPSKSVTAFAGISEGEIGKIQNKCSACEKGNCTYRRGVI